MLYLLKIMLVFVGILEHIRVNGLFQGNNITSRLQTLILSPI